MLPIVLIHKGNSFYLPYSLLQAKHFNPESKVFLIGDQDNQHYQSFFIEHINISEFFGEARNFEEYYQHKSTNNYYYELFCFQRWFILKEFMYRYNFDFCFYIDSDLLLFSNLSQEYQSRLKNLDLALSRGQALTGIEKLSGHNSYLTKKAVNQLCKFLVDFFKEIEKYDLRKDSALNDMTILKRFSEDKESDLRMSILSEVHAGSKYDNNINASEGFKVEDGVKKVLWDKKAPYCIQISPEAKIYFKSLHFQGGSKKIIKHYYQGNPLLLVYYLFLNFYLRVFRKIKNNLQF